jgi:hypothetical protein
MVQWNDVVEEIPSSGCNVEIDDFLAEEDNEAAFSNIWRVVQGKR